MGISCCASMKTWVQIPKTLIKSGMVCYFCKDSDWMGDRDEENPPEAQLAWNTQWLRATRPSLKQCGMWGPTLEIVLCHKHIGHAHRHIHAHTCIYHMLAQIHTDSIHMHEVKIFNKTYFQIKSHHITLRSRILSYFGGKHNKIRENVYNNLFEKVNK